MKKIFYLNKEFIKNELGIENVVTNDVPITLVNDKMMTSKRFIWKSLDGCKNDELFKNIKGTNGVLYIQEMENLEEVVNIFIETNVDEKSNYEITTNYKEANIFVARIFA